MNEGYFLTFFSNNPEYFWSFSVDTKEINKKKFNQSQGVLQKLWKNGRDNVEVINMNSCFTEGIGGYKLNFL